VFTKKLLYLYVNLLQKAGFLKYLNKKSKTAGTHSRQKRTSLINLKKEKMVNVSSDKVVTIVATEICEAFTIKLRSDGILHSHTSSSIDFNVESLKKFNVVMGKMLNYKKAPLLITFDEFAIPPVETRHFWALKDSCPYASADAYITATLGHKLIGSIYLKFNKPERPTKLFTNEKEAIEWLKTFL
jgi:hypothetical protein